MPQTAEARSPKACPEPVEGPDSRKAMLTLALTDPERRDLMRLMYRVLEEIETDKRSYRVLVPSDPNQGRLLKGGEDITERTHLDERAARRFLFLARLK